MRNFLSSFSSHILPQKMLDHKRAWGPLHLTMACLGWISSVPNFNLLLMQICSRRQWQCVAWLGPCYPLGKPGLNSQPVISALYSSECCGHWKMHHWLAVLSILQIIFCLKKCFSSVRKSFLFILMFCCTTSLDTKTITVGDHVQFNFIAKSHFCSKLKCSF